MTEINQYRYDNDKKRPVVSLVETKKEKTFNSLMKSYVNILNSQGIKIGSFELQLSFDWSKVKNIWSSTLADEIEVQPEEVMITTITIDEEYRHQGYGKSAYLALLKQLRSVMLVSGNTLTGVNQEKPGSYQMWESLVKDGRAIPVKQDDHVAGFISIPEGFTGTHEELEAGYWEKGR